MTRAEEGHCAGLPSELGQGSQRPPPPACSGQLDWCCMRPRVAAPVRPSSCPAANAADLRPPLRRFASPPLCSQDGGRVRCGPGAAGGRGHSHAQAAARHPQRPVPDAHGAASQVVRGRRLLVGGGGCAAASSGLHCHARPLPLAHIAAAGQCTADWLAVRELHAAHAKQTALCPCRPPSQAPGGAPAAARAQGQAGARSSRAHQVARQARLVCPLALPLRVMHAWLCGGVCGPQADGASPPWTLIHPSLAAVSACRLEEAYEAAVARMGGLHSARPKALLTELQPDFPELTLPIIKW